MTDGGKGMPDSMMMAAAVLLLADDEWRNKKE